MNHVQQRHQKPSDVWKYASVRDNTHDAKIPHPSPSRHKDETQNPLRTTSEMEYKCQGRMDITHNQRQFYKKLGVKVINTSATSATTLEKKGHKRKRSGNKGKRKRSHAWRQMKGTQMKGGESKGPKRRTHPPTPGRTYLGCIQKP